MERRYFPVQGDSTNCRPTMLCYVITSRTRHSCSSIGPAYEGGDWKGDGFDRIGKISIQVSRRAGKMTAKTGSRCPTRSVGANMGRKWRYRRRVAKSLTEQGPSACSSGTSRCCDRCSFAGVQHRYRRCDWLLAAVDAPPRRTDRG